MNSLGLMGRIGNRNPGGHHFWVSRDYADVDCQAVGCMFNKFRKCSVPSLCKIGDDGRCAGFQAKAMPPKIDGD